MRNDCRMLENLLRAYLLQHSKTTENTSKKYLALIFLTSQTASCENKRKYFSEFLFYLDDLKRAESSKMATKTEMADMKAEIKTEIAELWELLLASFRYKHTVSCSLQKLFCVINTRE